MISILIAFLSGFLLELASAFWVRYVADKLAVKSAAFAVIYAACLVFGLDAALHRPAQAVAWVLGFGLGSFVGVQWSKRK